MKELTLIRIALANLEPQLDYIINLALDIHLRYNELQTQYAEVCRERDNLKLKIEEYGKHNTDDKKSEGEVSQISN